MRRMRNLVAKQAGVPTIEFKLRVNSGNALASKYLRFEAYKVGVSELKDFYCVLLGKLRDTTIFKGILYFVQTILLSQFL